MKHTKEVVKKIKVKRHIRVKKLNKNTFSKYVGVSKTTRSKTKPFRSWISINNKYIHLGVYPTEVEAAIAYNNAALKYFGENARLNIINDKEE